MRREPGDYGSRVVNVGFALGAGGPGGGGALTGAIISGWQNVNQ